MPRVKRSEAEQELVESAGPEFLEALARGLAGDRGVRPRPPAAHAERRREGRSTCRAPRSGARCTTLVQLGYAETDGRLFRLTPRILTLASSYLLSNPLSEILQPAVERAQRRR